MNWIVSSDTIIFDPEFNQKLDIELISGYKIIIFSNFVLNERLFESYANNDFYYLTYKK